MIIDDGKFRIHRIIETHEYDWLIRKSVKLYPMGDYIRFPSDKTKIEYILTFQ